MNIKTAVIFLAVSWIATRSENFNMMSNNYVVKPNNLACWQFFSSLLCVSFTCPPKVTPHPSQFPWWGSGQRRNLGLLHNYFFSFLFLLLTYFLPLILAPYCVSALTWDLQGMRSSSRVIFFSPWLHIHLFPHNVSFHMCPLCPPAIFCPVWKLFEQKYNMLLWLMVFLVCNGSLHPCQRWLMMAQRRK